MQVRQDNVNWKVSQSGSYYEVTQNIPIAISQVCAFLAIGVGSITHIAKCGGHISANNMVVAGNFACYILDNTLQPILGKCSGTYLLISK